MEVEMSSESLNIDELDSLAELSSELEEIEEETDLENELYLDLPALHEAIDGADEEQWEDELLNSSMEPGPKRKRGRPDGWRKITVHEHEQNGQQKKAGQTTITGPGNVAGKIGQAAQFAMTWLQMFSSRYADKLPDSYKLHLPCCMTKTYMYGMLQEECAKDSMPLISIWHFLRLWRNLMTHIVIPKRSRFSICDTCVKLKTKLSGTLTKKQRKLYQKLREIHLKQQNQERSKYYKHISKAKSCPEKYLSVIIDAMDHQKTSLPRFQTDSKTLANIWKLKVNLMGVIVHGIGVYGFVDCFQWSHGATYTLSILFHTFCLLETLPDVLYLQMDNCPGQNKNKFTLGFLAYLIEAKIFKKIKVSFLMVGHTHEDIDQVFSRFSVWLRLNNVLTLDELMEGYEKCYHPKPTSIRTHAVLNFGEQLQINTIRNHSKPHVFKLTLDKMQRCAIQYKKWTTDKEWINCRGDEDFIQMLPEELVDTITPSTDALDLDHLRLDMKTVYRHESLSRWWDDFINELIDDEQRDTESMKWLDMLKTKKERGVDETSEDDDVDEDMKAAMAELQIEDVNHPIPPVTIGKVSKNKGKQGQTREMLVGDLVLTDCVRYCQEFPQLAKVLEIKEAEVHILWYKGHKTTSWTPATRPVKGQRGKRELFHDTINKNVIWLWNFSLTPSGMLPKTVKDAIDEYIEDM